MLSCALGFHTEAVRPWARSCSSPLAICKWTQYLPQEGYEVTVCACLSNRSKRCVFIDCHGCKYIDFGEQPVGFSFPSWMDFRLCEQPFFWYFSFAVFLKLALFNPKCLALLSCLCWKSANAEPVHVRELCQYYCLVFCCLENKISLVKKKHHPVIQ